VVAAVKRDAGFVVAGLVFIIAVFIALALAQMGFVRNPITLGLVVTGTGFLLLLAYWLQTLGVLSGEALGIFFVIAFGVFLIVYGFAVAGLVPAAAVGEEGLVFTAILYTLLVLLVVLTLYMCVRLYVRK